MEIYLDANATTPILTQASAAALATMAQDFGNPSSIHSAGLRARAMIDAVRARARRVLGASGGRVLFLSGATEGIQTSVLSALSSLRGSKVELLLYGATEHKAVPEALKHWNALLGLGLEVLAIPVGANGRHDLHWLREHAPRAGLVCTMAANNETGVISDLDGIEDALADSPALWLVDSVQALGKLPLNLAKRRIDYAPFSGHKLYAPKGIGMLYVREGAPFTPLMAGGGQEGSLRSGTENTSGIAALGAVLSALQEGATFRGETTLASYRRRLTSALELAFPGLVFNAPPEICLPTTLNFSVPGLSSKLLLDLFDAAGVRVSGGSACGAAKGQPSYVLEAMGLSAWQTASAVRMSFGPMADADFIEEACTRIRACGDALRRNCISPRDQTQALPAEGVTRFVVDGACCYLLMDAASRRCVVIDPLPELTGHLTQLLSCMGHKVAAVLDTHSHGDHASSADDLRAALRTQLEPCIVDALGWPQNAKQISLGEMRLTQMALPGHTEDSTAYLLHDSQGLLLAFVGDTVLPGALGRSDFAQSAPMSFGPSLLKLARAVEQRTLLLPGHDYDDRFATTLATESAAQPLLAGVLHGRLDAYSFATGKASLEQDLALTIFQTLACGARVGDCDGDERPHQLAPAALPALLRAYPDLLMVDVREPYEQGLSPAPRLGPEVRCEEVPLSRLISALPGWLSLPPGTRVLFLCRSGNRSSQAAKALRRLGHSHAWSLAGGLALWPSAADAPIPESTLAP